MSVLNLNSAIYEEIKKSAKKSMRKIGDQAAYLALIGLFFSENPNANFKAIEEMAINKSRNLKVTG